LSESGRRVVIAPAAQRQLHRLAPGEAARLRGPILALAIHPHPPGAAKLTSTDFWRLRVGDLRIVYLVDGGSVVILRVARRSERTYRQLDR
jgi:mRNA-degrading endonuclease RelE of RelBE toxin-antitoxin system